MNQYVCTVCGYVYDEASGSMDQGIPPGTKWEDVPGDFICPLCGDAKSEFKEQISGQKDDETKNPDPVPREEPIRELSFGELAALCSNLSKGCEKQYREIEADLFAQLARYYEGKEEPKETKGWEALASLVQKDLDRYGEANRLPEVQGDRGALRALVWGEKVTRILASLLGRYQKGQDALLEGTNLYVCEICGFIYLGDVPPEICPVCKVPDLKIRKIEREAI